VSNYLLYGDDLGDSYLLYGELGQLPGMPGGGGGSDPVMSAIAKKASAVAATITTQLAAGNTAPVQIGYAGLTLDPGRYVGMTSEQFASALISDMQGKITAYRRSAKQREEWRPLIGAAQGALKKAAPGSFQSEALSTYIDYARAGMEVDRPAQHSAEEMAAIKAQKVEAKKKLKSLGVRDVAAGFIRPIYDPTTGRPVNPAFGTHSALSPTALPAQAQTRQAYAGQAGSGPSISQLAAAIPQGQKEYNAKRSAFISQAAQWGVPGGVNTSAGRSDLKTSVPRGQIVRQQTPAAQRKAGAPLYGRPAAGWAQSYKPAGFAGLGDNYLLYGEEEDYVRRQVAVRQAVGGRQYDYQKDAKIWNIGAVMAVGLIQGEEALADDQNIYYPVGGLTDQFLSARGFLGEVVELNAEDVYIPLDGNLGSFFSKIGKAFGKVTSKIKTMVKKIAKPLVATALIGGGIVLGATGVGLPAAGALIGAGIGVATKKGSGIGSFRQQLPRVAIGAAAGAAAGWLAPAAWGGGGGAALIGGKLVSGAKLAMAGLKAVGGKIFSSSGQQVAPAEAQSMMSSYPGDSSVSVSASDWAGGADAGAGGFDWTSLAKPAMGVAGALFGGGGGGGGGGMTGGPGTQMEIPPETAPEPGAESGPSSAGMIAGGSGIAIAVGAVALLLALRK
jgi:hypothetical protein